MCGIGILDLFASKELFGTDRLTEVDLGQQIWPQYHINNTCDIYYGECAKVVCGLKDEAGNVITSKTRQYNRPKKYTEDDLAALNIPGEYPGNTLIFFATAYRDLYCGEGTWQQTDEKKVELMIKGDVGEGFGEVLSVNAEVAP